MDAVTRLLADLVAIPSVNPMGRVDGGAEFGEKGMSDYLEGWLVGLGVAVDRREVLPGRTNVIARFEAPRSARVVLWDVHQDTVPVDGMTIAPFTPVLRDGKLHGRGACDIKGGMAAMLTAFARLVRERPSDSASVILACTVDEEFTHVGSSSLAESGHGADLAIVSEPTMLDLVDRHKGAIRWKVRTEGIACHSSTPNRGVNAIYRMARVVSALSDHADELAGATPDPVLGPPSLSVGLIAGGSGVNTVPDRCEINIDRRVIPGEVLRDCPDRALAFLRDRLGGLDGVEFLPPWVIMPPLIPRADDAWLPRLKEAVAKARGSTPSVLGVPYGTDAGPLGERGLPCYVIGPGDIAQAHTEDEWVDLDQVRLAAEVYYAIARGLG